MDNLIHLSSTGQWVYVLSVALCAGLVKGVVGFGMPLVFISGLSLILPPEIALAGLIIPTVFSNFSQALRQGLHAAIASISKFRWFLCVGGLFLISSTQLTALVPGGIFLGALGVLIVAFSAMQLVGVRIPVQKSPRKAEITMGAIAGFIGGMSGVWGPPTVALLTALETEKKEQMRIQGVIYGLGAIALTVGHLFSGILNTTTATFSAVLVLPAMIGLRLGMALQDRIDQTTFKRATLCILLVAGLNLVRRAWIG
jgi:uncharacterized membrane protein YfcA